MNYRTMLNSMLAAALFLSPASAFAETERNEAVQLEDVVVTATKTERKVKEVPASVTVIKGEEIKQWNVRDLSDVLRKAAGIDISRYASTGVATVNIRGLGFTRSLVLIDGQPADFLDVGVGGRLATQIVDPGNIERIEIVRGAGSALYGPSAMGGVINIITKKAPKTANTTRLFFDYDSIPTLGGGASTGGTVGKFGYSLNLSYKDSEGYKPAPDPAFMPGANGPTGTMLHDLDGEDWTKKNLGGRFSYLLGDKADIAFTFNYLRDTSNAFGRPNTESDVKTGQYGLEYRHSITDAYQLTAALSYRDHEGDYDFDSYWVDPDPAWSWLDTSKTSVLDEKSRKFTAEIKNQWDITPNNRLLFGLTYTSDEVDLEYTDPTTGQKTSDREGDVVNYGVYLQDEMKLPGNVFLTLGARYDAFDYDLNNRVVTFFGTTEREKDKTFRTFNPRAALRFNATESTSLRASAGAGYRAPDSVWVVGGADTAVYEVRPNTGLDPEKSVNFDLGIDQKLPFGLSLSATAFYSKIKDAILTAMFMEAGKMIIQGQNVAKVESQGIEVELEERFNKNWSALINYTYTKSKTDSSLPSGVVGLPEKDKQLARTPYHKALASIVYNLPGKFTGRVDGRYVGRQYASGDTTNSSDYKIDDYFVADCKFTAYLPLGETTMDISVGVNNIFDKEYSTLYEGVKEEPRVFFAQIGYRF